MANVVIGIAALAHVRFPDTITTYGLGSCVGVTLFDKVTKNAGMVHVLLPSSSVEQQVGAINKAKYANLGVEELLDQMIRSGARRANITAKMAGGAHMFGNPSTGSSLLNIGERNIAECKVALQRLGIPLIAEDTAGQHGRTITINSLTGGLTVKSVGKGEKVI